jgi:F1F0 ATPase subunit 2
MLLGTFYFTGLWMTLQRLFSGLSRARLLLALALSYLVRLSLALAGFFWLASLSVSAFLGGVAGFTLVAVFSAARRLPRKE